MGKLMIIPFLLGTYGKIDDHRNMRYSVWWKFPKSWGYPKIMIQNYTSLVLKAMVTWGSPWFKNPPSSGGTSCGYPGRIRDPNTRQTAGQQIMIQCDAPWSCVLVYKSICDTGYFTTTKNIKSRQASFTAIQRTGTSGAVIINCSGKMVTSCNQFPHISSWFSH
jgi:hypothetical protein